MPCLMRFPSPAAPPPSRPPRSQGSHLVIAVANLAGNEPLAMCGGLRWEEHEGQRQPNQRSRRKEKKEAGQGALPLAPSSPRKALTSSSPSAARAATSS